MDPFAVLDEDQNGVSLDDQTLGPVSYDLLRGLDGGSADDRRLLARIAPAVVVSLSAEMCVEDTSRRDAAVSQSAFREVALADCIEPVAALDCNLAVARVSGVATSHVIGAQE